jgi:tetratricopeptide (TPR) repeat protein
VSREYAAELQVACGQLPAAVANARKAVTDAKDDPEERFALSTLAWVSAAAGRAKDSEDAIAALVAIADPLAPARDARRVAYARGRSALERKDFTTAIDQLQRAQAALSPRGTVLPPPEHVPIWFALGEAYMGAGQPRNAEVWFQKVADAGTERAFQPLQFVRSFYYLGRIHEQAGDLTHAREAYRRFVSYWKDGTLDRDRVAEAERKIRGQN